MQAEWTQKNLLRLQRTQNIIQTILYHVRLRRRIIVHGAAWRLSMALKKFADRGLRLCSMERKFLQETSNSWRRKKYKDLFRAKRMMSERLSMLLLTANMQATL